MGLVCDGEKIEGMKMYYVENVRLPTEKAHGYQIMKTCEALSQAGVHVHLIAAERRNALGHIDPFTRYGITRRFSFERLPVIDWISSVPRWLEPFAFYLERWTFLFSLRRMKHPTDVVWYTRNPHIAAQLSSRLGVRVFLELHALPKPHMLARLNRVSGVVCLTNWLQDSIHRVFPNMSTAVIPDAVDVAVFDPAETRDEARRLLGLDPEAELVVYGGRFSTLEEGKGLELLDSAVATLSVERPRLRLVLVGGTVEEFRQIEGRLPSPITTCVDLQPRDRLALYYRAADALIMPFPDTPHYAFEMSPLKMFEYMASGTPIVSSDLPSVRDVLDESSAQFFAAGSKDGLVAALRQLFSRSTEERMELARRARAIVSDHTWKRRAEKIQSLIQP